MSRSNLWDEVLSVVETRVHRPTFFTWFKAVRFKFEDDEVLHISMPSVLFRDWFLIRYAPVVDESLAHLGRGGMRVSYTVDPTPAGRYAPPFA